MLSAQWQCKLKTKRWPAFSERKRSVCFIWGELYKDRIIFVTCDRKINTRQHATLEYLLLKLCASCFSYILKGKYYLIKRQFNYRKCFYILIFFSVENDILQFQFQWSLLCSPLEVYLSFEPCTGQGDVYCLNQRNSGDFFSFKEIYTPIHQGEKRTKYISRVNNSISQRIESSISTWGQIFDRCQWAFSNIIS